MKTCFVIIIGSEILNQLWDWCCSLFYFSDRGILRDGNGTYAYSGHDAWCFKSWQRYWLRLASDQSTTGLELTNCIAWSLFVVCHTILFSWFYNFSLLYFVDLSCGLYLFIFSWKHLFCLIKVHHYGPGSHPLCAALNHFLIRKLHVVTKLQWMSLLIISFNVFAVSTLCYIISRT